MDLHGGDGRVAGTLLQESPRRLRQIPRRCSQRYRFLGSFKTFVDRENTTWTTELAGTGMSVHSWISVQW